MDMDIALILTLDGITTGAIYVLIALGTVLIFSVTRVIFVPFGDIAAFTALTMAAIQMGRVPGTVLLVAVLAGIAAVMEGIDLYRREELHKLPRSLLNYGLLPCLPAIVATLLGGVQMPMGLQMLLTLALVLPIAPLLDRIAFRPLADASVLVLLIVAVAVHFAVSGLALLFFGPEGFRTQPISSASFELAGMLITAQMMLMVGAAIVFSGLLFLYFEHTIAGKSLRATAVNRTGARLVGIRPVRTGTLAYLLASLLAGISGLLIGPVTTLYYDSGFVIGLKAFVGAIIGGLVSYPVTALGAIFVGILESFASFSSSTLKETIVFSVLIPILLWRSFLSGNHDEEEEEIES